MKTKVTKHSPPYPQGYEPDYIDPIKYCPYRYAIGRLGKHPLVAICMNPSAASNESSDKTINRIINISNILGMDGWIVFNTYPQRATDKKDIKSYNKEWAENNIQIIREFLSKHQIHEVWGAWGDDEGIQPLCQGRELLLSMLAEIGVKVYYYGTLTKALNPRHPIQRQEKIDFTKAAKQYLTMK